MASAKPSSTTTTLSHYNERGQRERWPVLVYRLQSHRGWEVYCDPDMEAASKNKRPKQGEELTAAPREGCIEVRKMRLRIRLFEQDAPWERLQRGRGEQGDVATVAGRDDATINNTTKLEQDADIPGVDGWNNNALLVRRLNTLLISTRRGMGAVVFKFKNNQECIEFCDRLVFLNRDYFRKPSSVEAAGGDVRNGARDFGYVNGMDEREYYCHELRENKRRRLSMMGDQQGLAAPCVGEDEGAITNQKEATTAGELRQNHRKDELLSYIVRLAHDEEFRGFVDEIERGLQLTPDTAGVHSALGC